MVICEPQCKGFVHEEANAGILYQKIIKEENLTFFSDKKHFINLKNLIFHRLGLKIELKFKKLLIPTKLMRKLDFGDWFDSFTIRKVIKYCKKKKIDQLLFLSVNSYQLFVLNKELRKVKNLKVTVVLHGITEELDNSYSGSDFRRNFIDACQKMQLIFISPHVKDNLIKQGYDIKNTLAIHHPYIWNKKIVKKVNDGPLKICSIGYIHEEKGSKYIKNLIMSLMKIEREFHFDVFGYLDIDVNNEKIRIHNRRFSRDELDQLIPQYDFIISPYDFDGYFLKVSGILFDSLNYKTPIITFKNTFTDYYFNLLGEIGYLLEKEQDLYELVSDLVMDKRKDRLKRMIYNCECSREKLALLNYKIP